MRTISLITSILGFIGSVYFFVVDFNWSTESNHVIYMCMLATLIIISTLGIFINTQLLQAHRKRGRTIEYNSYSDKRVKNKEFDEQFSLLNRI